MKESLKDIYRIQQVLRNIGYYDISRISNEILDFSKENCISLDNILSRIESHEPWEYIRGEAEFCGNKFLVDRNTLIPRIETEQIVSIVYELQKKNTTYNSVIDVGTGSGCIIISLAKILCNKNNLKFFATEKNLKTLKVAKKNSVLHKVNKKVLFLKDNLIFSFEKRVSPIIIANLPYIPTDMFKNLEKSVIYFEPESALDGGKDGLKYYRRLKKQIEEKMKNKIFSKDTILIMEIESSTLGNVRKLFKKVSKFEVIKDCRGKNRFCLIHFS